MAAAHPLAVRAVGHGGMAGAFEKSTKKALPLLCFAVAAAAALESALEMTGLLVAAASKLTKNAWLVQCFAASSARSRSCGLPAAGESMLSKHALVEPAEMEAAGNGTVGNGDALSACSESRGLARA